MSTEMDFLKRSTRFSRLEKIRNNVIREKMNIKNSVWDYIIYIQLNWYVHVQRLDHERLPRRIQNGAYLEDEEWEDLEICGCRSLQRERERGELATWNGSTGRGGERKLIYLRHRKT